MKRMLAARILPTLFFFAAASLLPILSANAQEVDLTKIKDHPVVSRFAGSKVIAHARSDFDAFELPLGPMKGDGSRAFAKSAHVEGKITRIAYESPEGKSMLEIYRNYADALRKAGFESQYECAGNACGDANSVSTKLADRSPKPQGNTNRVIDLLWSIGDNMRLQTAHLQRAGAPAVDLNLVVVKNEGKPAGVLLTIVEQQAMTTGQVVVDAKAMDNGITKDGHIALYGIEFDTDSASLKASSDQTLAQMAALMKQKPELKVYIVGHTDNVGALAHNQTLSQQRAESVMKALSAKHGVAAARMIAKGLASYAPVASNAEESGRARNRRVELVAQ